MLVEDLERVLDGLAPRALTEPWDTTGLLVGRRGTEVSKVIVALDLTEDVVVEAVTGGYQAIITHHPLLFAPLRRVTDADRRGVLVSQLIAADVAYFAAHTNLDGAVGGLCDLVAHELGLLDLHPLVRAGATLKKFVGFVPPEAIDRVSGAMFAAGAGRIGEYRDCAFAGLGEGAFVAGAAASPHVGRPGRPEQVAELRWETVVPAKCLAEVINAYLEAHPYEEPAFDVYSLEDVLTRGGQGRVGSTRAATSLLSLAETAAEAFGLSEVTYAGDGERIVDRVAVVTGSGGSLMEVAAGRADVFVTGDLQYHDAERAADLGLDVIVLPHGRLETWAMRRWTETLGRALRAWSVPARFSTLGRSPWHAVRPGGGLRPDPARPVGEVARLFDLEHAAGGESSGEAGAAPLGSVTTADDEPPVFVLRTDGGSRGNPGPSAIGVILEDDQGTVLEEIGACIGTATSNQAEYQALITGLETAVDRGVRRLLILADSELLVRQMRQEYKVRNAVLKELYLQARALVRQFDRVEIKHVPREENVDADALVNRALDGLT
ncbi:MAG: Nif3-like dinuclear metal center hexameric protein [Thermoleophilia bacterium]|nr:Nif3-like dinuclear metal center hexameric protein [Thermoleophilia bacterium]